MGKPLRALIVEDSLDDALLLLRELRSGGYDPIFDVVQTAAPMKAALARQTWDIVISDYKLPQFSAPAALALLHESGLDLPFIIVSGTIGEDTAVAAMKAGAHDYFMKNNLARLNPVIERELREAVVRRQRREAEAALRISEERYMLAVRGAKDGVWDWDLQTNEVYFSSRWKSMLGCEEEEIGNSPEEWFSRVHAEDIRHLKAKITAHIEGRTPHLEIEHRMMHGDGRYHWMLTRGLVVRDASEKAVRMAGSQTDVTERRMIQEKLLHDAFHDSLTSLPNRALFIELLEHALQQARKDKDYLFAVLFLDLDRFKVVNDSLGHVVGDQLLIEISRRLERCVRGVDTVARLGGDEFTILLDGIKDIADATNVADRIQTELAVPVNLKGHEVFTTASIGVTLSSAGCDRPENLLRDADTAMYRAKALGKARYQVFEVGMHTRAVALLKLETDLWRAIERQEFRLHYQPIVSLKTGKILAFEAVIRWEHPERGLVFPAEFIHVVEETGLIVPIGWWTLDEACRQARSWQTQFFSNPPLAMSVNLSTKQFMQPDLIVQIDKTLKKAGLDAHLLGLEITESTIMENAEVASATLNQLRARGIHLCIDDFGTGYSSFSYLHRFPIDTLKIDRSFVSRMVLSEENVQIVGTIVTLARHLGVDVVAEGVETEEQLSRIRGMDCEQVQGYFFSKPMDSHTAGALIGSEAQWGSSLVM